MIPSKSSFLSALILQLFCLYCDGQDHIFQKYETKFHADEVAGTATPAALPFPRCRAGDIDCLRRGIRTFLIFMDSGRFGMKAIDPTIINSVAISLPEQQMSVLLRNVNVTGARWSKLLDRRFNLEGGKSGILFSSDLHVTGEIRMTTADRLDPYIAYLTMDIQGIESNITYTWTGKRGIDNEDYILIGPERIAARNTRIPTFFLEPNTMDAYIIGETLQMKQTIVDHLANEITTALMHTLVDNFRLFATKIPVKHYYEYY